MWGSEIYHLETGEGHGGRVTCPSRADLVGSTNTATGEVDSDQECTNTPTLMVLKGNKTFSVTRPF